MFNPINPANYSKTEKDGADALSMKYYAGSLSEINIVYNFRERWDRGNFAARFETNCSGYDLSLMSGYFDKRFVAGSDFAGNLFDAGIRGEIIFTADKDDFDQNFFKYILGADYQFNSDIYALIEYHFNGQGTNDTEE
jgi:hypothetical protein